MVNKAQRRAAKARAKQQAKRRSKAAPAAATAGSGPAGRAKAVLGKLSGKPGGGAAAEEAVPGRPGIARTLVIFLIALVGLYALAIVYLRPSSPGQSMSLTTFNRLAVCGSPQPERPDPARTLYCQGVTDRIEKAEILDEDARIVGTVVPVAGGDTTKFWTSYPKSDAATAELLRNLYSSNVEVNIDQQTGKRIVRFVAQFLLPLMVLAVLFALLFLLIQGRGASASSGASEFLSFGKAGDKRQRRDKATNKTFADVAAAEEAVIELKEVRDYLANPSAFAQMGALPPKGVLLVGPPGCGKTLLGRAVAGEAKASFLSMSGSEFVEALVGVGAARVRDLFAQARAAAPAIIFIDELDAVGRHRGAGMGQGHDEREQTLNELLVQMDGFSPAQGIVVMAASNRPDILDPALLRAGRFDRHITVERPDLDGRTAILGLHAQNRRLDNPSADLPYIARHTSGFSGADLANLLNESALLAVREKATTISRHHLEEAVDRVLSGPRRRGQIMAEDERRTLAYHEAGHAVVAAAHGKADAIQKVSIIARGRGIGHLAVLAEDKTILRRGDLESQITIAMAGFAAEELLFGEPSSGSEADIERATAAARDMAGRFGMSMRLGPVRILAPEREVFLGRDYLSTRDVSQPTLEHLDEEVRRILDEQKAAALSILGDNRAVLDRVAEELVATETLQGLPLDEALGGVKPYTRNTAASNGAARAPRTPTRARRP